MWLSGANAAAGSLRGQAIGQAKCQVTAASNKATKDIFGAWTAGLTSPPAKKRKRR
jgi:hypothetical protein